MGLELLGGAGMLMAIAPFLISQIGGSVAILSNVFIVPVWLAAVIVVTFIAHFLLVLIPGIWAIIITAAVVIILNLLINPVTMLLIVVVLIVCIVCICAWGAGVPMTVIWIIVVAIVYLLVTEIIFFAGPFVVAIVPIICVILMALYDLIVYLVVIPTMALLAALQCTFYTVVTATIILTYFTVTAVLYAFATKWTTSTVRQRRIAILREFVETSNNVFRLPYHLLIKLALPLIRLGQIILILFSILKAATEQSLAAALSVVFNTVLRFARAPVYNRLSFIRDEHTTEDLVGRLQAKGMANAGNVLTYQIYSLMAFVAHFFISAWLAFVCLPVWAVITVKAKYEAFITRGEFADSALTRSAKKIAPIAMTKGVVPVWDITQRSNEAKRISAWWEARRTNSRTMQRLRSMWWFIVPDADEGTRKSGLSARGISAWIGRTTAEVHNGDAKSKLVFFGGVFSGTMFMLVVVGGWPIIIPIMILVFFMVCLMIIGAPVTAVIALATFMALCVVLVVGVIVTIGVVCFLGSLYIVCAAVMCILLPVVTYILAIVLAIVVGWIPVIGQACVGLIFPAAQLLVEKVELPLCKLMLQWIIRLTGGKANGNFLQEVGRLVKFSAHTQLDLFLRIVTFGAADRASLEIRETATKEARRASLQWALAQHDALCAEARAAHHLTQVFDHYDNQEALMDDVQNTLGDKQGRSAFVSAFSHVIDSLSNQEKSIRAVSNQRSKVVAEMKKRADRLNVPPTFIGRTTFTISNAMENMIGWIIIVSAMFERVVDFLADTVPAFIISRYIAIMYYQDMIKKGTNRVSDMSPTVKDIAAKSDDLKTKHGEAVAAAAEILQRSREMFGTLEYEDENGKMVSINMNECSLKEATASDLRAWNVPHKRAQSVMYVYPINCEESRPLL